MKYNLLIYAFIVFSTSSLIKLNSKPTREETIKKLLEEYKETKKALELGLDWLNEKDYAKGKLDLVNVIIADLEKLSK